MKITNLLLKLSNYFSEEIEVPLDQLDNYCPLKEKVFEDLWNKGNYVTGGEKFGGDFLLYPGKMLSV